MKERKSALLVLSALAAFALTACDPQPAQSSTPAQTGADSSATSAISSSESEPSSVAPSSTAAEDLDNWAGQAWIGQYQGGFTTLIINEDKSTSWDTDTTHYPAQIEVMDNGIFHIFSTNVVPAAERVDIYTDGTMAYFSHDANAKDRFIADKNASYEAEIAFAKNANGSLIFGSIAVSNSKTKFFRYANGAYQFDVKVDISYGGKIDALGAIFDVTIGGETSTYHAIEAGDGASGKFAIIESYQVVVTEYYGEAGDLVIAKNGDETVYIKINNDEVDLEDVTEENNVLIIKEGERTLDNTDPSHMEWIYNATKYTLNEAEHTYVKEDATTREDVFHQLDLTQNSYSGLVGGDGNLWACLTPSVSGYFSMTETTTTSAGASSPDGYIAIYEANATAYTTSYALRKEDNGYNFPSITDMMLNAGKTYIIKAGAYADRDKVLGDTTSNYANQLEAFSYTWSEFNVATYTDADNHTVTVETYQGEFKSVTYDGVAIENAKLEGNVITSDSSEMDFVTDPANPQRITTSVTITLDPDTMTFVYEADVQTEPAFHVLTEADSGNNYSAIVGDDGNLWAVFTPTSSGYLTIEEKATTSAEASRPDGYLAIYNSSAAAFTSTNALVKEDNMYDFPVISNFPVDAGVTYIIKAGAYADKDKVLTSTGSVYSGKTETIYFEFSAFERQAFDGDNGELVLYTENGEFRSASIGEDAIENPELVDNGDNTMTLSSRGAGTIDTTDPLDPIRNSTDTTYTLDVTNHTYTVSSTPNSRHVIQEIPATTTSGTFSTYVDGDGNLWAKFTPTADGYITVEETVSTSTDGYLAIYLSTATSFATPYSNAYKYADSGAALSGAGKLSNVPVTAGVTYIIKAGAWADKDKLIGATGSNNVSKAEEISFQYNPFTVKTYTNDNGGADLTIKKAGDTLVEAKLGTATLTGALDENGNFYIAGTPTVDNTDPLNPTKTSTDTVYELDNDNNTYVVNSVVNTRGIFLEVSASKTITEVVGADGNLWIKFTAPSDGTIDIEELVTTSYYGCIGIYAANATAFTSNYALEEFDGYDYYSTFAYIEDFEVTAGQTYIIKAGSSYDAGKTVVSTGSTYAGKTESVQFTFNPYSTLTYTNSDGADLVITMKGSTITNVMLGDQALQGAKKVEGNLVIENVMENDGEGHINMVDYTYILDGENNTYEVEAETTPYVSSTNYDVAQGSTYNFAYDADQNAYTSNNAGANSSNATMTITINEDGFLSFDYFVSSESATYDYLQIKLNGTVITDPAKLGGTAGMSGHIMIEVHAGDIISFSYLKDSSVNGGKDCAVISNLVLLAPVSENPEDPQTPEPGTSEPATSEPATSEPATSEPVNSESASSESVNSESVNSEPGSSESDTSGPVSTDPLEAN